MLARVTAPRGRAALLVVTLSGVLSAVAPARANEDLSEVPAEEAAPFPDARFGPRYVIDDVVVRGNHKTAKSLIVAELAAIGLGQGTVVDASDPRVETARYRLLTLGYFLDVRLSVTRGASRGGVILVVDVEERGTLVINELFPSTSAATAFWGGADVSETNFLGRGVNIGLGAVASTKPIVLGATSGLGLRLRAAGPPIGGLYGLSLSGMAIYNDGSEFYRTGGDPDDPDPGEFIANRVRRIGGVFGLGRNFRAPFHGSIAFREERVTATLPSLVTNPPIDYMIKPGSSQVGTIAALVEVDTRSDPILPRSGMRVALSVEAATDLLGSSYQYVKTVGEGSFYWRMPHGHALGLHVFAGAIAGDAPFFDRFFVGDLNLLLPRRALGINFSTMPSRNFLDSPISSHRYDDFAGRILIEYAIPIWRRRGFVYGGDAFAAVGPFGMASRGTFRTAGPYTIDVPIDLTADVGLRLDTYIGIFTISIANALSRSSF
jgi:hypothetical protein